MRLDARKGDIHWSIYHAEECRLLRYVLWIDSDTAQWCDVVQPMKLVDGELVTHTHQARKIAIYEDRRLVIINPIADEITIKETEMEAL